MTAVEIPLEGFPDMEMQVNEAGGGSTRSRVVLCQFETWLYEADKEGAMQRVDLLGPCASWILGRWTY